MVYARNWFEINNGIDYTERSGIYFHINQQTFIIYYWIQAMGMWIRIIDFISVV